MWRTKTNYKIIPWKYCTCTWRAAQHTPSTASGNEGPLQPTATPDRGTHHYQQQHKAKEENVHNCLNAWFQEWTLMRTQGKLYFKDAITPKQKATMAFMWQSLVLSVIHIHCLYPLQLRKLFGNIWNGIWYLQSFWLTATRVTTTIQCCVWTREKFKRLRTQTCWHEQTQQLYFFCSERWLLLFHTSTILLHLHFLLLAMPGW